MILARRSSDDMLQSVEIRVRGRVQGVGFRPSVWQIAHDLSLNGEVLNDSEGVLIRVCGNASKIAALIETLRAAPPPLAEIVAIETRGFSGGLADGFHIVESQQGASRTQIAPDAATCEVCAAEVLDPFARRFRYPFTNCTHCGPRLSIVRAVPYDRATTSMEPFPLCAACESEYRNPADRRFHAEATACHICGPKARLIRLDGRAIHFEQHSMLDDVDAALSLIQKGEIVAIKGLGGYQLACDATRPDVVARLRVLKRREAKPFALMARDLAVIARFCAFDDLERAALVSREAPIVLMRADGEERLPEAIAPGMNTLGFMLPSTPLHILMLRRMARPVVMTSGNLSDAPQIIDDVEAALKLGPIAAFALVHNREIANRMDDSVVRRMDGAIRVLRRARGYAPAALGLPPGFAGAPDLLAFGAEMKSSFCLIKDGQAVLSQHQGDLEDAATFEDYTRNIALYRQLFDHAPKHLAADLHPEYLSTKLAVKTARQQHLPLVQIQHHHAHAAACLAENMRPLDAPPVLAIVLDGLGLGHDGTLWGGEFLLADYRRFERLGTFKPVAMPGGAKAAREPWRNLYAHLMAEMGWAGFAMNFGGLPLFAMLEAKPLATLAAMLKVQTNVPQASSCGRLFDAVAAATGLCFEHQAYEGEAGARLEAGVCRETLAHEGDELAYPFAIPRLKGSALPYIEPLGMWQALLGDLILQTPVSVISARFHKGLAKTIVAMVRKLAGDPARFDTVALSGGCFQNAVLFEEVARRLRDANFTVLAHAKVPANDGGIALGQALIAAAHCLDTSHLIQKAGSPCA
ncbi:MAG: carbamoyltransferase HypF [Hyphomicrobiales bacterium]|nr:carbamoyltransferase HypF [Hyphomicrobiales bacterium]MDE2115389.1 carbamoyltransferase HypF [Hyphomicrobiales bacterium]